MPDFSPKGEAYRRTYLKRENENYIRIVIVIENFDRQLFGHDCGFEIKALINRVDHARMIFFEI